MNRSMASVMDDVLDRVEIDLAAGTVRLGTSHAEEREQRDLVRRLSTLVYEHLHVGHRVDDGLDVTAARDFDYERDLAATLAGHTVRQRVPLHGLDDTHAVVNHLGLRVRVPVESVTVPAGQTSAAELEVPVLAPALSPGFALARGAEQPTDGGPMLRVYLGAQTRDDATAVYLRVLDQLRGRRRWQAKVASQTRLYPRSDAVTVYLHVDDLDALGVVVGAARRPEAADAPTSVFTLRLAPGVGCAWEPDHPHGRRHSVSFGQHRARVLAQLLVARADGTWHPGDTAEACRRKGIDPGDVWRNVTSPVLKLLHRPVQARPAALAGHQ